jgi:hypothetical protein
MGGGDASVSAGSRVTKKTRGKMLVAIRAKTQAA